MRHLFILIIFLFSLSGCCSQCPTEEMKLKFNLHDGVLHGPLYMYFPKHITGFERLLIIDSVKVQLEAFEKYWGKKSRPVTVFFHDQPTIPCGDLVGKFWGCHYGTNGPIHVIIGDWYSVPALYHELIHHNHPDNNDHDHKDPRWPKWRSKQAELFLDLEEKHKALLGK